MNTHLAIKIPVIESEKGWGQRTDDYMVCLSLSAGKEFIRTFNKVNNLPITPDWYMFAEDTFINIEITDTQKNHIESSDEKREWLSKLMKL
jgi:hypothetical protein